MAITFIIEDKGYKLKDRMNLKLWMRRVLRTEGRKEGEINYFITTDERLHEMNVQYLQHDTLTDIITFDNCVGPVVSGDIAISRQRVSENAEKFGVTEADEMRRVMIHGLLHLCGYKDKTAEEKQVMRKKEDEALRLFDEVNGE